MNNENNQSPVTEGKRDNERQSILEERKTMLQNKIKEHQEDYEFWKELKEFNCFDTIKVALFALWCVIFPVVSFGYSVIKYMPENLPGKAYVKGLTDLYPGDLITLGIISGVVIAASATTKIITHKKIKQISKELRQMKKVSSSMDKELAKVKEIEKGNTTKTEEKSPVNSEAKRETASELAPGRVESTIPKAFQTPPQQIQANNTTPAKVESIVPEVEQDQPKQESNNKIKVLCRRCQKRNQ